MENIEKKIDLSFLSLEVAESELLFQKKIPILEMHLFSSELDTNDKIVKNNNQKELIITGCNNLYQASKIKLTKEIFSIFSNSVPEIRLLPKIIYVTSRNKMIQDTDITYFIKKENIINEEKTFCEMLQDLPPNILTPT